MEDVGVRRHHHVDEEILAVDPDRLRCDRQVVGRRLALLLRSVLGVRLDVVAEQVEQRHRQVLAGGDRPPAAHRVEADRDAPLGHQVGILRTVDRELADVRVGRFDGLLVLLLLIRDRLVAQEVDRQVEHLLVLACRQHVLHRSDQPLGLEVAAAHPERA